MKHKNSGFTLIELVVVIVILGILAATAAPKFLDFSSDARASTVNALAGTIKSGAQMINAKAIILGVTDERNYGLDIDNDGSEDVELHSGYPGVFSSCNRFTRGLTSWLDIEINTSCSANEDADWYGLVDWNTFYFMPSDFDSENDLCYVSYQEATGGSSGSSVELDDITVTVETSGC
ncbi:pilus assembly FimT family protein [Pseudocolwellia agarivorans]|uniref:pilus assembly FimT family protein n=1 Tax=Pseudocolwellia agarivorans TaxID=1911682 RepID=UPI003F88175D